MPEPKQDQLTIEQLQAALAAANAAAAQAREAAAQANGEKMMARAHLEAMQAAQELLEARRQLALGNEPDDAETEAEMIQGIRDTNHLLREQKKFIVELYLAPEDEGKGLFEIVQINGGNIFQIERGASVEVPESIYQVLVASHLRVRPQRREDIDLVMKTIKPGMRGPNQGETVSRN